MTAWSWLALLLSVTAQPQASPHDIARDIEEVRVQVGDVSVGALCTDGPRRVLLLQGEYPDADPWRPVLQRLPPGVGACAYAWGAPDGADGDGDDEGEARGWYELLDELRSIHAALGFDPPYVLVGHGLGGLYARLYASARRQDVGGLVLLEPAHEDLPALMLPAMPHAAWEAWMEERSHTNAHGVRESTLAERARRARLPDIPVTVITATRRSVPESWDARFVNEAARQAHQSIVRGLSAGRHVPARTAGPDIPADEPGLVADEIARVVRIAGGV